MNLNFLKNYTFWATLNFVLGFVGFQCITTLLIPNGEVDDLLEASQTVTIPYRGLTLLLSFCLILFKPKKNPVKLNFSLFLFFIFWSILLLRLIYDIILMGKVDISITIQFWLYIFGIILPFMISIVYSYKFIDLSLALKWLVIMIAICLIISTYTNGKIIDTNALLKEKRQLGNAALNSISFGHLGGSGLIISLFLMLRKNLGFVYKLLLFCIAVLGLYNLIKAGSRGPILSIVVVLFVWSFLSSRNRLIAYLKILFIAIILYIAFESLLGYIGDISPLLEERLRLTIYEGNSSNRDDLFYLGWSAFLESPIFGSQFAIFNYMASGDFIYVHNVILEAFMSTGVLGGAMFIVVLSRCVHVSFAMIANMHNDYWVALLFIQNLIGALLSGSVYYDTLFSGFTVFMLLINARGQIQLSTKLGL
jgi:O-antigen ligase